MDSTINCTRVLFSQGTNTNGTPDDFGLAPDNLGLESAPVSLETNEEVVPNHSWRTASDTGHEDGPNITTQHTNNPCKTTKQQKRLLQCTKTSILSTFNTRTLGPVGRLEELVECSENLAIDVIAI